MQLVASNKTFCSLLDLSYFNGREVEDYIKCELIGGGVL